MKRFHFITGLVAFVAFLATGMFMRSRHIFILAAALLNLVAGCYLSPCPNGWRRVAQAIGSGLLILAPFPLVVAFFLDPKRSDLDAPISHVGLYALFAATVLHVVSCWRKGPVQSLAGVHPASDAHGTSS